MAKLCSHKKCLSCMACYNACPFNAITIIETERATKVPYINNQCRNCEICENVCPILNPITYHKPTRAIALYSRNEIDRATCSSGGVATVMSRYIIEEADGVVFGATAIDGYPRFVCIDNTSSLDILKGSKYVYCDPGSIYQQVKKDLKSGRTCLFIGLPCDIAGLKQFLRKDYLNLYTIDLICHGAPPFKYLKEHLATKISDISTDNINITFRGVHDFYTSVFTSSGKKIYSCNQYEDEYFTAFMRGIIYRPSCYECPFAKEKRISDITIGDFWGIEPGVLNGYSGKISLALINTIRGENLFDSVQSLFHWQERSVTEAVTGNSQLRHPTQLTDDAIKFQNAYSKTQSITEAFRACGIIRLTRKNKIRRYILTIPKYIRNILKRK